MEVKKTMGIATVFSIGTAERMEASWLVKHQLLHLGFFHPDNVDPKRELLITKQPTALITAIEGITQGEVKANVPIDFSGENYGGRVLKHERGSPAFILVIAFTTEEAPVGFMLHCDSEKLLQLNRIFGQLPVYDIPTD